MYNKNIGDKIRTQRKKRKITLSFLSEETGLSIGYLSNLENNLSSPRLDDLHKICECLNVSLVELLSYSTFDENVHIIRKQNRETIFHSNTNLKYEAVKFGYGFLEGLFIEISPKHHFDKTWHHNYDEIGLIIKGQLIILVEDKEYVLNEGDSIYIRSGMEHSLCNKSDIPCESYWVSKPSEEV